MVCLVTLILHKLTKVINYIKKQEEHHSIKSFNEEYIEFLKAFELITIKDIYLRK
jgi:putative transposase